VTDAPDPRPIRLRSRHCPLCDAAPKPDASPWFARDGWRILRCHACGFAYLPEVPEPEELAERLAWEKAFIREAKRREKQDGLFGRIDRATRWRLHLLPRTEPVSILAKRAKPGAVVDIGCGDGRHMLALPPHLRPVGIEVSHALAEATRQAIAPRGGEVICAPAAEGAERLAPGAYTGALLRSYLEHEAEPARVLRALHRALAPGGIAVVKVPNFGSLNRHVMGGRWCGVRLPDHVNYFTPGHLRRMADATGFDSAFPPLLSLPTDDNMIAVLTRR
jgi:SAM-dependent methyltransferase